jgi:hypothetical protein
MYFLFVANEFSPKRFVSWLTTILFMHNFSACAREKIIRRRPDSCCCSSLMGHLWVPLEACVPWSIDEGSKDQSRIIVMVLDGSMEQRNTLEGRVPWCNISGGSKGRIRWFAACEFSHLVFFPHPGYHWIFEWTSWIQSFLWTHDPMWSMIQSFSYWRKLV